MLGTVGGKVESEAGRSESARLLKRGSECRPEVGAVEVVAMEDIGLEPESSRYPVAVDLARVEPIERYLGPKGAHPGGAHRRRTGAAKPGFETR